GTRRGAAGPFRRRRLRLGRDVRHACGGGALVDARSPARAPRRPPPLARRCLPDDALYAWDAMCAPLAAETHWWTPGTAHGYHAVTFGWLVGEVVRRITGGSLGTYFRQGMHAPLGLIFRD